MSIESKMEKLASSIDNLAAMIAELKGKTLQAAPQQMQSVPAPQPPAVPVPPASAPVPTPAPVAEPTPASMSAEEANARLVAVAQKMADNGAGIQALLRDTFKVSGLRELDPSRYADLVDKSEGLINAK